MHYPDAISCNRFCFLTSDTLCTTQCSPTLISAVIVMPLHSPLFACCMPVASLLLWKIRALECMLKCSCI